MKRKAPKIDLYTKSDLEIISQFNSTRKVNLSHSKFKGRLIEATLEPRKDNYELSLLDKTEKGVTHYKKLRFSLSGQQYLLSGITIDSITLGIPSEIQCSIHAICSKTFTNKVMKYHKAYIPIIEGFSFHNKITLSTYATDLGYWSTEATQINLNGEFLKLHIVKHKAARMKYLVITSDQKQYFEDFQLKVSSIQTVLGYLLGKFPGDKGHFLQYSSKKMDRPISYKTMLLRNSFESAYHPLDINSYRHLSDNKTAAKEYYNKLQIITTDVLSKLIKLTFETADFAGVLLLISEASTTSLLSMPGSLVITLEIMTRLINEDKTITEKFSSSLIPSKAKRKLLFDGWRAVLKENTEHIPEETVELIHQRIDNLLLATNRDKLKVPFLKLKIDLNDRDIESLDARNDFLHGRFPNIKRETILPVSNIRLIDLNLLYCSVKYYTMINMLILKWVGFKGKIINYPKLYERTTGIYLEEEYYRDL